MGPAGKDESDLLLDGDVDALFHAAEPKAVFDAYSQAKQQRYEAMRREWLLGTLPWYAQELDETRALMGDNFWPYGVEANTTTLNALFQYSYEQGLAKERLTVDKLFHPTTLQLTES